MPLVQIKIPNQLLIPFGGPKWSIERISVIGVSTTGTYIQSDTPLAHIDRSQQVALRLLNFTQVMPGDWPVLDSAEDALALIQKYLTEKCEVATESEAQFLALYFDFVRNRVTPPSYVKRSGTDRKQWSPPYNDDDWVFDALLPLPQAHLYQSNPLDDGYSFAPNRMMKVDFAFWTGKRLVAIEIDGGSHIGNEAHIQKDRLLQRSGVHVIHILNSEIAKHGLKVIDRLLPSEITQFWSSAEQKYRCKPIQGGPFKKARDFSFRLQVPL